MVLDTHIWVWFVTNSRELSQPFVDRMNSAGEKPMISSISIWEAVMLGQRGKIRMVADPESTVRTWMAAYDIEIVPVDTEIAFLSRTLDFQHADPADRFIAATAYHLQQPLATVDRLLTDLPWLHTIGA
jgi:PIN domain nuclease of toxin-antitoxin system